MQQHQHQHSARSPITAAQATAVLGTTATRYVLHRIPRHNLMMNSAYSPSPIRPSASRNGTGDSSSISVQSAPRQYTTKALSEEDLKELNQTSVALHDSSLNFQAHIAMIKLLHKGFLNHRETAGPTDAHTYELIADLRQAREAMDSIYPLGEDAWYEWISDEQSLARSVEDHIKIMTLCTKATTDEPDSAKLWRQFGEYMYFLYGSSNEYAPPDGASDWSDEDRLVGKEVFTWASVNDIWERAVVSTQWRLNDSNIVWDRYMEILISERARGSPNATFRVEDLQQLFIDRLLQPHATWDNTFSTFSTFVSNNVPQDQYESIMASTNQRASSAKQMWSLRELFELKISTAAQNEKRDAEYEAYSDYLTWEVEKKGVFSGHLVIALYERAITRFPAEKDLWEEYVEYLIQDGPMSPSKLQTLERATRHCPWSGSLWSHRLLALEDAGKDFTEMERVKHTATKSGILELFGMEELLKVYIDWCGFLRRRAFQADKTDEDDLDIAEVGIKSALEHVQEIGERMYGKDKWPGDPQYRLERIHIKFLTQAGNVEASRDIWAALTTQQHDSYDFWYRWYIWEMVIWAKFAMRPTDDKDFALRNPTDSTGVLKQALGHIETMDWPEQLLQMYLAHCEQHESVSELQQAHILTRKLNKQIQKRRVREQEEAEAKSRAYYEQHSVPAVTMEEVEGVGASADVTMTVEGQESTQAGKRKLDTDAEEQAAKKMKTEPEAAEAKRDREHTTVLVKNLPIDTTSNALRKFLRGVGEIVNIAFAETTDGPGTVATVEFGSAQEAEFALSRSGRDFEGIEVEITYASGSTLWVTNYPPEADEQYLRDLFQEVSINSISHKSTTNASQFGEIIDIRLPSLQGNTHRRFCYIQFATPSQALAATSIDGKPLHAGKETFKLKAKISDPSRKTDREGALYEGRELIVKQLHWQASEAELKELFGEYGTLEKARIPRNAAGKSKGSGFVTFETAEQAKTAAAALDGHEIRGRKIAVEVATPHGGRTKRLATRVIDNDAGRSGSPASVSMNGDQNGDLNGTAGSPASEAASAPRRGSVPDAGSFTRKERTIYLTNIPDTVNDARVQAFLAPYGQLKKISLRPDHHGAIAEFATVADAGKAEMRIPDDAHEFVPGQVVRVVDEAEFFRTLREVKSDKLAGAKKDAAPNGSGASKMLPSQRISRPGLGAGARPARRGGLGIKKGGLGSSSGKASDKGGESSDRGDVDMAEGNGEAAKSKKSNDDFRALLMGKK